MLHRRALVRAAVLAPFALPLISARAQAAWPQRPVKFILSQPAGSGPDILARYVGEQLSRGWAQPVVVENRPGGQNVIGAQAAARSAPDGYTFYYATTAAMVTNVHTFKALPYDPAKDFVPVRLVGRSPFVIAAGPAFKGKDLADALAQAKAEPGKIAIASEGQKTFSGMLADSVAGMAGAKFNHVAYTKATDAMQDVIGGRVPLVCLPEAGLKAYLQGGQVRALAVSTAQRLPELANVPALSETFKGFEYTGWNGVFAPPTSWPASIATSKPRCASPRSCSA
jgi:tripartite-type tricarboxylate transporter receptor subunit TctC